VSKMWNGSGRGLREPVPRKFRQRVNNEVKLIWHQSA